MKKIVSIILGLWLVFNAGAPVFANSILQEGTLESNLTSEYFLESVESNENAALQKNTASMRIANVVEIKAVDVNDHKVKISIQNIGVDTVDRVKMRVKIWNVGGLQYNQVINEYDIIPFLPRNNSISITDWTKVTVTEIEIWDGNDYSTMNDITLNS